MFSRLVKPNDATGGETEKKKKKVDRADRLAGVIVYRRATGSCADHRQHSDVPGDD